ncbi:MAG: CBS domain-containing protein [Thermodesulfobacteriota bacterium]|nr:CBS domain-containing protein [Thermodesulfobacteriota bacterium]
MDELKIKDIMVHLEEYVTVHQDSSLLDAIHALEEAQQEHEKFYYKHRAILVYDDKKKIVGKLSQRDLIKSMESKYDAFGDTSKMSLSGFSPEFIKSMIEKHSLWQDNLDNMCKRVAHKKVSSAMYIPTEGEKIEEGATLGEALHMFVVGHHQSLLVTRAGDIVGILRLVDVFKLICERIKECKI